MASTPRSFTTQAVYHGRLTSVTIDPLDQTKRPKQVTTACPDARCTHDAWLHRTGTLAPLFESDDETLCSACYDCSTEDARDDDTDA